MNSPLQALLLFLLRAYQLCISPLLGPRCRFFPSCSSYAIDAVREYGALRGCLMAAVRLCKCHPWHPGGFDPVPKKSAASPTETGGCNHY